MKKTVDDINVSGKRVLVRCDFNVPLDKETGAITDTTRIVESLPTIKKLLNDGGRVILCSHLGKAKGEPDPKLSLRPVAEKLSELLGKEVKFADDDNVVGENAKRIANELQDGEVMLLQNTRYRAGEEACEDEFSQELASLAEVFVNDAFGTAHRAHASNVGVTKFLPNPVVGYLMEKEVKFLGDAVDNPVRPFVAILGGLKVKDKIKVIDNLLDKVDVLIIGGAMAYTFLVAKGYAVGNSVVDEEKIDFAKDMMAKAEAKGVKLLLPIDTVVAKEFAADAEHMTVDADKIPEGWQGLDIGEKTVAMFKEELANAKTVIWNGPMGVFEFPEFAKGTLEVAKTLSEIDATTIIGGGDSASAVNNLGFGDKMSHISTGGGASLEFLEGEELPALKVVENK
ncbi:MAG: phosphoglycerate kinase [Clostridia bacterium]|nr:phosphoglycerate kinase [Clostridia bacterium]